jgi:carbamoyltransferase
MTILGINAYHADSSAAILADGKLLAATEEERFTRVKHWAGFPSQSIQFCLKEAGLSLNEVDFITIGRDPKAKFARKILFLLKNPSGKMKAVLDRVKNARKINSIWDEFARIDPGFTSAFKSKIKQVEHHRSHLASAFFASPFEEAVLLSIDGSGDFTTTMTATGKSKDINIIDSVDFPHSVGLFYTTFTQWLGFPNYGDEYKVMGLSPFGEPKFIDKLRKIVLFNKRGLFSLDLSYFRSAMEGIISYDEQHCPQVSTLYSAKLVKEFGEPRKKNEPLSQYHKDIAASVQRITEELIFYILKNLQKKTGLLNVCIAGGVAQNSVANGKIIRHTGFKNIYIPPAGHDAGISIGSALYLYNQTLRQKRMEACRNAFTGCKYSNEEIEEYLKEKDVKYNILKDDDLFEKVTDCLMNGGVVGWFSGRAEFGPRALGGRSILADPRRADAKELLNTKIKRRESFRPFASSILKDHAAEYFEDVLEVPFMEKVFRIKIDKRSMIPAVVHVDGSGRMQSVEENISPRYYRLIEKFYQKTGIPLLLNTSFNENEPIVNAPAEALDCFLRTKMDMLVLENCLVER